MEKWIETGKIEPADLGRIYELLSAPLPQEGVQHAAAQKTKKGYDTTGYRTQFAVNRMNEVCGIAGWKLTITEKTLESATFGTTQGWEAVITLEAEIGNPYLLECAPGFQTLSTRTHFGGQRSRTPDDALKGALGAATSKVLSLYGVGKLAYEGGLDEALKSGEPAGQQPERMPPQPAPNHRESAGKNGNPSDPIVSTLKPHERANWKVNRIEAAQVEFHKLGADAQFSAILAKFRAKDIGEIRVAAIENVRKALLEEFEKVSAEKEVNEALG